MPNKQKIRFGRIGATLVVCATLLGTVVYPGPSQAQVPPGNIAQYLEITPTKYELSIPPGQTVQREITITNRHIGPISLQVSFDNVVSNGDEGETKPATGPTPWDLKTWATVSEPTQFRLAAREARKVTVTLNAPPNASPGGYYGVLKFTPTDKSELPPVAIQGEIGGLFLVRVPGQAREVGQIKELFAERRSGGRGFLALTDELRLVTIIHNDGNVHFATEPKVRAKGLFGGTAVERKFDPRNVFPESDRKFSLDWPKTSTGFYTLTTEANLPNDPTAKRTAHVLVVTPRVALGILIVAGYLVFRAIRRRRARQRSAKKG